MITASAAHPTGSIGAWISDLVLQLRKGRISKVILGGALANMCVESHLRNLLRKGFEPDIRFYSTKPRGLGMGLAVSRSTSRPTGDGCGRTYQISALCNVLHPTD